MSKALDAKGPTIPYHSPSLTDREETYMLEALRSRRVSGDGPFTKRCNDWLIKNLGASNPLLTHSCTAALEMAAILCDLKPGDEVVMPSFTFVSTANAVALRGAVPVFVDIRPDTLNIDEKKIEAAITAKTKAITVVHYAGVACEMDSILALAKSRGLKVVEDAAQGLLATYKGKMLGTMGDFGCLSFHETKNIVSGEGGALFTRDAAAATRAEIVREKGTNRSQFFRGQVDKYTWTDLGSSYLPSDILAAVLLAQLERAKEINSQRVAIWNQYQDAFKHLEGKGVARPHVPTECRHNGHIYYLITRSLDERQALMMHLKENGIQAPFHYVPLHLSPAGRKLSRAFGSMKTTEESSDRLIRLPLFADLKESAKVIEATLAFFAQS